MSNAIDYRELTQGAVADDDASDSISDAGIPEFSPQRDRRRSQNVELDRKSKIVFWLFCAILHSLSLIPDFILSALGVLGGRIAYRLDRPHVRIGLKNLEIAFPEKSETDRRQILRDSYINLGRSIAEYIRLGGFFYRRLKKRTAYKGLPHFARAVRSSPGKGVLILYGKIGNFELLLAGHALRGYQISMVHHTQRFLAGDALLTYVRERAGVDIIRRHSAARAALRALKEGDQIGIPFDQNAERFSEAVFVPFFGEQAAAMGAVARLAMISQAPVVPVFMIRQPDQRNHLMTIHEAIPVQRTGDVEADVIENTRRFVKAIEDAVRAHPDQFFWVQRRFRTRPRGMAPVYDWEVRKLQ